MKKISIIIVLTTFCISFLTACSSGKNRQKKQSVKPPVTEQLTPPPPVTQPMAPVDSIIELSVSEVIVEDYSLQKNVPIFYGEHEDTGDIISYKLIFKDSSSADPAGTLEIRQKHSSSDDKSDDRKYAKKDFQDAVKLLEQLKNRGNRSLKIKTSAMAGKVNEVFIVSNIPEKKEGGLTFASHEEKELIWPVPYEREK